MKTDDMREKSLDWDEARARLAELQGQEYWRSLDELAGSEAFVARIRDEFPAGHFDEISGVQRRTFLKLMGASFAMAGVTACTRQPEEKIVPYVRAPENLVPGKPLYFATAMPFAGYGLGLLAESHMGRPTKLEGNEQHPASLGGTDAFGQASVLGLYDPDRSRVVLERGAIRTWSQFADALRVAVDAQRASKGAGLRLLTGTVTSPTLAAQIKSLLADFPQARWHQYEPAAGDGARAGAQRAFGSAVATRYDLEKADVLLSLDADFLASGPAHLSMARAFANRRRAEDGDHGEGHGDGHGASMNRLYVVEPAPSVTGGMADHRLPLRAADVEKFARSLAAKLGVSVAQGGLLEGHEAWIDAVASDLRKHRGASAVLAGEGQPAAVHALAHAINAALGNIGHAVVHTEPVEAEPVEQAASIAALAADMEAGKVEALVMLGVNPVYSAPADLAFVERLQKVAFRVHLGQRADETAFHCDWHVPEAHYLEAWSDVRAFDGTASIVQPLIAPLYGGKSAHEMVEALKGRPTRKGYDVVREFWQSAMKDEVGDSERLWRKALHDGIVDGTAAELRSVSVTDGFDQPTVVSEGAEGLELVFRPDATVWDGEQANNGWLQELPKPLTQVTWDNVVLLAPATAEKLEVTDMDLVELKLGERSVTAPVWRSPGHAEGSATVSLGYGRTRAGQVGSGLGYSAYELRASDALWFAPGLQLKKTGGRKLIATTQHHHDMEGRHLVREATVEHYRHDANAVHHGVHEVPPASLAARHENLNLDEGYGWGMTIDLNVCTGCSACVVACQSENNIPVVGKEQVAAGREMHWIRIDRYHKGDPANPETYHQPVPCMHCENAPCEPVCPVAATAHSSEGLNDMIYNRCIGTRYCANNCPYKVRRFNFLLYSDFETPSLKLQRNPDVSVRSRGVMEKCTFCVQRINASRIEAKKEGREIRDGEVVSACQQSCPVQAITFGNVNDPESRVSTAKAGPRNYGLLTELNTNPRTTYLAKLRNPNPELEEA